MSLIALFVLLFAVALGLLFFVGLVALIVWVARRDRHDVAAPQAYDPYVHADATPHDVP